MKVLELFAGTRSIGKAFESRGHEVLSIDIDKQHEGCLHMDIAGLDSEMVNKLMGQPDIVWASPDCATYSVAALRHHRRKEKDGSFTPTSDYAMQCDVLNEHVLRLIHWLEPRFYFIENPRGVLRKMPFMQGLPRYTVTYCQYGDTRMKPTDIWTNHPNPQFLPPCRNGDPCHEASPRGCNGGTQALKNKVERARIPAKLCEHIVDICEDF